MVNLIKCRLFPLQESFPPLFHSNDCECETVMLDKIVEKTFMTSIPNKPCLSKEDITFPLCWTTLFSSLSLWSTFSYMEEGQSYQILCSCGKSTCWRAKLWTLLFSVEKTTKPLFEALALRYCPHGNHLQPNIPLFPLTKG